MNNKVKKRKQMKKVLTCPDKHTYSKTIYPSITAIFGGRAVCKCGKVRPLNNKVEGWNETSPRI